MTKEEYVKIKEELKEEANCEVIDGIVIALRVMKKYVEDKEESKKN